MLRRCFHLLPTRNIHVTLLRVFYYNVRLCITLHVRVFRYLGVVHVL